MDTKTNKNIAPTIRKLAETARELYETKYALNGNISKTAER